jgi:hypothetical protein
VSALPLAVAGQRIEVIVAGLLICGVIFELIRRKHLLERFALLWLGAGIVVLVFAIWQGALTTLSHAVGIYYPPAALFGLGFLFVLVMLLHFSITVSRLSDQNKVLAQRVAMLRQELERERGIDPDPDPRPGPAGQPASRPEPEPERTR